MRLTQLIPKASVPERTEYPPIDPVPEGIHRPFWSVMIPTYNRAKYLEQTLKSVLEQDPGPDEMQIEVIDNCSTKNDPEEVIRKMGQGRVHFYRQPSHVGMSENWTTCIKRSRGYWVHILHDDDVVLPGFYAAYKRLIEEKPEIVMVFCRAISIDEDDEWIQIMYSSPHSTSTCVLRNAAYELVKGNFISAPTVAATREAYEKVGGFASCLPYSADWEMWMRIAASGSIGYIHRPYLLYRVHSDSDTSRLILSSENIKEIVRAIEIGVPKLPPHLREKARSEAYKHYSAYADDFRSKLTAKRQYMAALRHALWAFRLYRSFPNLLRVVLSAFRCLANGKQEDHCPNKSASKDSAVI